MDYDLTGQVIIITGANSGIGKVAARELARMGATVVMACRSRERGAAALADVKQATGSDDVHLLLCDLSSEASVRAFAQQFLDRFDRLDVLINNAGSLFWQRETGVDGVELTLATNHLGPFLLTNLLLERLIAGAPARIVNVSSGAHMGARISWDDLQRARRYRAFTAYSESKLMNVLFTYELARRLEGTGVTVNALHPGFVRTNFGRTNSSLLGRLFMPLATRWAISEEEGADNTIYLAAAPEVAGVTSRYFTKRDAVRSSAASYDQAAQRRLWDVSVQLLNGSLPETASWGVIENDDVRQRA